MQKSFDLIKVAAAFAGTIIGAGFASGQEITQFFVSYGQAGLLGIIAAAGLFAWLGGALLELGRGLESGAYHEAVYRLCGRRLGRALDLAIALFLFCNLSIMLAGAATVLRDYFGLPYIAGLAGAGLALTATVLYGVRGIAAVNLIVAPLLIVSIISISLYSFVYHNFDFGPLDMPPAGDFEPPAPHWLLGCLLYVSYNLVVSSTVLIPLGRTVPERKARLLGGALGGLVLGLLAAFVAVVVMLHCPSILDQEVPLLQLACNQYPWSSVLYAFTLLAAMYTTAAASLYGCSARACSIAALPAAVQLPAIILAALICGQAGFATLIKLLFPVFGYATLCFTARLAWFACRGR